MSAVALTSETAKPPVTLTEGPDVPAIPIAAVSAVRAPCGTVASLGTFGNSPLAVALLGRLEEVLNQAHEAARLAERAGSFRCCFDVRKSFPH